MLLQLINRIVLKEVLIQASCLTCAIVKHEALILHYDDCSYMDLLMIYSFVRVYTGEIILF